MKVLKARDKILEFDRTYIMGILNVTPDSFSDGGRYFSVDQAVEHAEKMLNDGADIIDIGAQSTRPGFEQISPEEEWKRLEPVLSALLGNINAVISIDTFYPQVAKAALDMGVHIINDVTGFSEEMFEVVRGSGCGCVVMYQGKPSGDVVEDCKRFFKAKLDEARLHGISHEYLCFDPGIGFGKTYDENLDLIANTDRIIDNDSAFMMAASKKRVIGTACSEATIDDRGYGTISAHTVSQFLGANVLRVHDVREGALAAKITDELAKRRRISG